MIILINSENCPFRNSSDHGQTCNLMERLEKATKQHLTCEGYWNAYPECCPLLNEEVTIKRKTLTENVQIEDNNCYTADETGWICGIAEENLRLKKPIDGKCAVCGSFVGDTTYYKLTDGKEIKAGE